MFLKLYSYMWLWLSN